MEATILQKLTEYGVLVGLLAIVCWILWQRIKVLERKREERDNKNDKDRQLREERAAEECQENNRNAVKRIQALEERSHGESLDDRRKMLEILQTNARGFEKNAEAFNKLADIEKSREDSGSYPVKNKEKEHRNDREADHG